MPKQAFFLEHLDPSSDDVALIEGARQLTYSALCSEGDSIAKSLGTERKLVFLEARNTIEAVTCYIGCLRGGHVVFLFNDTDQERLASLVEAYQPNVLVRHEATGPSNIQRLHDRSASMHADLAVLLSTSGSTGSPKLVKLTRQNLTANANAIVGYLGLDANARGMASLKFAYSYGMSIIHSHLACGGSLVLTEHSVTTSGFWDQFELQKATSFAGVPYTFEMLDRMEGWERSTSLKVVTQAGGRLQPDIVQRMAEKGQRNGWRFVPMYGQTEASPRMAYLPECYLGEYSDSIGIAIPGGSLSLVDDDDNPVTAPDTLGELVYAGPNVMMGYAQDRDGLSSDETPPFLKTGDIAVRLPNGLYKIVGRKARFIKPFGVRINLDEVQLQVRKRNPGAVCTGTDDCLIIALPGESEPDALLLPWATETYQLPSHKIRILPIEVLPLLPNEKVDYQSIIRLSAVEGPVATKGRIDEGATPGNDKAVQGWDSVAAIFASLGAGNAVSESSTFISLSGDSLSYVVTSLAIEEYLGYLPASWESKSVQELERLRFAECRAEASMPTHYLNVSRVLMLLLGVPFHAAMIFDLRADMIIAAPERSLTSTLFFTFIHSFRMFAYFFISGYFSILILRQTAVSKWMIQQAKRLGLPLLMGALILSPLEVLGVAISPVRLGPSDGTFWVQQMTSPGPQWLAQRWFLGTLLCLGLSMAGLVALYRSGRLKLVTQRVLGSIDKHPAMMWWGLVCLQVPLGLAGAVVAKALGHNAFLLSTFEYRTVLSYGPSFFVGALVCLRPKVLNWYLSPSRWDFILAVALSINFVLLNKSSTLSAKILEAMNWIPCGMLVTRAFIALMFRYFNKPFPLVARLTDASYIIYMWHIVFVLFFNDLWVFLKVPPLIAIALTTIGSFACSWLIYVCISRSSILSLLFNGGLLNGSVGNTFTKRSKPFWPWARGVAHAVQVAQSHIWKKV